MGGSVGDGLELAGGFDDVFHAQLVPGVLGGVVAHEDLDLVPVDDEGVVGIADIGVHAPVDGVVLEHIGHVIRGHFVPVDGNEIKILPQDALPENEPPDAAEPVDANVDRHDDLPP